MLNKQRVDIPLTVLREDIDPKVLPDGALTSLTNVQFDKQGRISKRNGYTALTGSDTLGNDIGEISSIIPIDNDQLIALSGEDAWHYNSDEWRKLNDYIPSYATVDSVFSSQDEMTVLDCSSCDDVDFYVYGTSDISDGNDTLSYDSIYVLGISRDTKQILFNKEVTTEAIIAGCTHIQDSSGNDYCLVVYIDNSTKLLEVRSFDMNGVSAGTQTTSFEFKVPLFTGRRNIDLSVTVNNSKDVAWVGFTEDGIGQYGLCNFSYDASTPAGLTGITATTYTGGVYQGKIQVIPYHTGDSMAVVYVNYIEPVPSTINVRLYTEVFSDARVSISSGYSDCTEDFAEAESEFFIWSLAIGWRTASDNTMYLVTLATIGTVIYAIEAEDATTSVPSEMTQMTDVSLTLLSSRLSSNGNSVYALLTVLDTRQEYPTQFLAKVDLTNSKFVYVNKSLIGSGRYYEKQAYLPKSIANFEYATHKIKVNPIYSATLPWQSSEIIKITSFLDEKVIYDKHHQATYFAGGLLKHYDNYTIANSTLDSIPTITTSRFVPIGTVVGAIQLAAHVELIDSQGNVTRSGVVISPSIDLDGTDLLLVNIFYKTNDLSDSGTFAKVKLYRTTLNGTVFYLERVLDLDESGTAAAIVNPNTDVASNQLLFTISGELEPLPIPSSNYILSHKNRLFLAGTDEKNKLYYSKEKISGFGTEFYTALSKEYQEDIVALGKVGEFLYVFSTDSVSYLAGNGPDSVGLNDTFSDFIEISKEIGCINKYSVVSTSEGVFFESRKGMFMINGSNQLTYIGGPIEDTLESASSLLRGVSHPKKSEVRWLISSNKMIVYNYEFNAWCTHELNPPAFENAVDIASTDGNFWVAFDDGTIWKESENLFTDDGEFIELYVKTGSISLGQMNQLKRIYDLYIHGNFQYYHNLVVAVNLYYDGKTSDTYTTNFNSENVFGSSNDFTYDLRVRLDKQSVTRMIVSMYDEESDVTTTPGESLSLNGLSLTVGMKGTNTKSSSKKYI